MRADAVRSRRRLGIVLMVVALRSRLRNAEACPVRPS